MSNFKVSDVDRAFLIKALEKSVEAHVEDDPDVLTVFVYVGKIDNGDADEAGFYNAMRSAGRFFGRQAGVNA